MSGHRESKQYPRVCDLFETEYRMYRLRFSGKCDKNTLKTVKLKILNSTSAKFCSQGDACKRKNVPRTLAANLQPVFG